MPTFEEALKNTLRLEINKLLERADADLHEEVVAASQVLTHLTQGLCILELVTQDETSEGLFYSLELKGGTTSTPVGSFMVPVSGYPIRFGDGGSILRTGKGVELRDRQAITSLLTSEAGNPNSPLVQKLAFLMRRAKSNGG